MKITKTQFNKILRGINCGLPPTWFVFSGSLIDGLTSAGIEVEEDHKPEKLLEEVINSLKIVDMVMRFEYGDNLTISSQIDKLQLLKNFLCQNK